MEDKPVLPLLEGGWPCRYIIGEIMYGGHVVEDWDRRLTSAYLQILFQEGLLEGQQIFPKFDFRAPTSNMNHRQVRIFSSLLEWRLNCSYLP